MVGGHGGRLRMLGGCQHLLNDDKVLRSKECGRGHTPAFSLKLVSVWEIFALPAVDVAGAGWTILVGGVTRQACRAYEDCREGDRWWRVGMGVGTVVRLWV